MKADDNIPTPVAMAAHGRMGPVFAGDVALEDVTFKTAKQVIIHPTSFVLPAGKIACILGPSGCGKTTLLKLLAGVSRPSSGRVLIDGVEVAGPSHFVPPEERRVGLMFQDFALFPHMTALENVAYGLYALPRGEALRVAEAALLSVGLPDKSGRFPSQLSGGEQQRVALARAIVPRPRVVLMDEPFSGLDQRLRETVRAETLSLLRQSGATAILVTHDPLEALAVADHIIVMREGRIIQQGPPEHVLGHPADPQVAKFLGPFNEFGGVVRKGSIETALGHVPAIGQPEGVRVRVFVAPGDIRFVAEGEGASGQVLDSRPMPDFRHYKVILTANEQVIEVKTRLDQHLPNGRFCGLALATLRPQVFGEDVIKSVDGQLA